MKLGFSEIRVIETDYGVQMQVDGTPVALMQGDTLSLTLPSGKRLYYALSPDDCRDAPSAKHVDWPEEIGE